MTEHICFQVTSDGKKPKIQETVDRYLTHQLFNTFPHLIQLMNTGWVEGAPVAKKRMKLGNEAWRNSLATITAQLLALRQLFTIHV